MDQDHKDNKDAFFVKDQESGHGSKVKGFRYWDMPMKQALIETKTKVWQITSFTSFFANIFNFQILSDKPGIEKGSSEFNRALLREFQKLYPKCMESSRSLYSRLQSIEKQHPQLVVSSENNSVSRSNSTDDHDSNHLR